MTEQLEKLVTPGTHDASKAKVGDEYKPVEITITEEMVESNVFANDDYNPWYMEDSPFGGRIAPPTILAPIVFSLIRSYYTSTSLPGPHAQQEFEFINPLKIGKKVKLTGRLVDRYSRRGSDYLVSEFLVVDEDGVEIVRMRTTQGGWRQSPDSRNKVK